MDTWDGWKPPTTVYTVVSKLRGMFLPDESFVFRRKSDALDYARSLARELRDDGYTVTGRDGNYDATDRRSIGGRDRVVETTPLPFQVWLDDAVVDDDDIPELLGD